MSQEGEAQTSPSVETETEIIETLSRPNARVHAYSRIIACLKKYIQAYMEKHPTRIEDERFKEGFEIVVMMLGGMLEVLDEYELSYKHPSESVIPPDTGGSDE